MWRVEAYQDVPATRPRGRASGWQTVCVVHHVATAEKQAINHRQETGALTRVRFAPGLTLNKFGSLIPVRS